MCEVNHRLHDAIVPALPDELVVQRAQHLLVSEQ